MTGLSSSRWAGSITKSTHDQWALARRRGVPVAAFRRAAAYAKNGRERYGLHADTEQRFVSCLAQTADRAIPVTARAARAYLDVAFFHPFDDGNARLAGLVLQFVLLREGVELDEVAAILTTVRRADDAGGPRTWPDWCTASPRPPAAAGCGRTGSRSAVPPQPAWR
ncbi:Fic family protein [Catellatospora sp. NPDC049111]|uniref:Fic family protein n=1 Tax=Catellatospora sp. NPDC049111 TaxID=3155271 RepID=UPI0034085658